MPKPSLKRRPAGRGTAMVYAGTSAAAPLFLNEPHSAAVAHWCAREKGELVAAAWCIPQFAGGLRIKQRNEAQNAQPALGA